MLALLPVGRGLGVDFIQAILKIVGNISSGQQVAICGFCTARKEELSSVFPKLGAAGRLADLSGQVRVRNSSGSRRWRCEI